MAIPDKLVEIREKNGYTRKRLADELGRPYRTITKYETGEREPGHEYIIEIAKKFGVTTDYLLGLEETKKSPDADESASEDRVSELFDRLNGMLVSSGLIVDGEDITSDQADVLIGVCRILNAVFKDAP